MNLATILVVLCLAAAAAAAWLSTAVDVELLRGEELIG